MRPTKLLVAVMLLSGASFLGAAACSSRAEVDDTGLKAAPLEGYTSTTVQDLVQTDRFKDKRVHFEAAVAKVGCVGCGGVTMADKTWRISVCPENPGELKIPPTAGTRVRIWGVLSVVDDLREVKAQRVEAL